MKKITTEKILKASKADKTVKNKTGEEITALRKKKSTARNMKAPISKNEENNLKNLEAKIYSQEGVEKETVSLPANIFGLTWNADLVHQVVVSLMSNKRTSLAHTKDRSEVSGGGKKPWQQKGLGRARHGSTRSPIWVKGGVAHGPRNEKNYDRKVNKKMKAKALFTILSKKWRDNEIFFIDTLKSTSPKTKEALNTIKGLAQIKGAEMILTKKLNSTYIATMNKDTNLDRGFKNFGNIKLDELRNINPLDIVNYRYLIIDQPVEAFKFLEAKMK